MRISWWYASISLITSVFLMHTGLHLLQWYHLQNAPVPPELQNLATAEAIEKMRMVTRYKFARIFLQNFFTSVSNLIIVGFSLIPRGWYLFERLVPADLHRYPIAKMIAFDVIYKIGLAIVNYLLLCIMFMIVAPFNTLGLIVNLGLTALVQLAFFKIHQHNRKLFLPAILAFIPTIIALVVVLQLIVFLFGSARFTLPPENMTDILGLFARNNFSSKFFVPAESGEVNASYFGVKGFEALNLYEGLFSIVTGRELLAVLSHELGHRQHFDSLKAIFIVIVLEAILVLLVWWLFRERNAKFFTDQGFKEISDEHHLDQPETTQVGNNTPNVPKGPVLAKITLATTMTSMLLETIVSPLLNYLVFWGFEYAADGYAVIMGYGTEMASSLIAISTKEPIVGLFHWLFAIFYDPHPTVPMRIRAIHAALKNH